MLNSFRVVFTDSGQIPVDGELLSRQLFESGIIKLILDADHPFETRKGYHRCREPTQRSETQKGSYPALLC